MISKNSIGLTIIVIETLLSALGVEFEAGTVAKAVEGVVIAGSLILLLSNQFRRSDIHNFFFKKTE